MLFFFSQYLPGESERCHTLTTIFIINDGMYKSQASPRNADITGSTSTRCDSKEDDHCTVV